ncbi:MAG: serine/threonine protein kinase, partial [Myxococcales bacterium]|nr:serine/threonine protein kinase [Myxococcales bacterium]
MLRSGDVIGARYRLLEPLASGGMGAVWRAMHTELSVEVALKVMLTELAATPSAEARFRREAQAAARLRSPHVVQVTDFGVSDGQPYLAMELLQGEDLQTRLQKRGRLPLAECATVLEGVAVAIELAHEAQIIHRDLKPANIFLAQSGAQEIVKVLD